MFTTYGIKDPRIGKFIYVGQTSNFEKRVKGHTRLRKKGRPNYGKRFENIKTRLYDILSEGLMPEFEIFEVCSDEEASLRSETAWVERLANDGHPLLNRWREHRSAILSAYIPQAEPSY